MNYTKRITFEEFALLLCERGFNRVANSTFTFVSKRDVINIFSNGSVVIITHDGENVVKNFILKQIDNHPDSYFWNVVALDVFSRF